jgi:4-aminobutyrate aminotransferase-like enzyme
VFRGTRQYWVRWPLVIPTHRRTGAQRRHEWIGDIRGSGLFIGVELVTDRERKVPAGAATTTVLNDLRDRGVLIGTCGPSGNVLKIRPPLVFEEGHADLFLDALDASLENLTRS